MSNSNFSEEDFARASALMEKRMRGLDEVCNRILSRFQSSGNIHECFMDCSHQGVFGAVIFFCFDRQIEEAERTGLSVQIQDAVFEELENVGRGCRDDIKVEFEFDSYENVKRNFGNYGNRMR